MFKPNLYWLILWTLGSLRIILVCLIASLNPYHLQATNYVGDSKDSINECCILLSTGYWGISNRRMTALSWEFWSFPVMLRGPQC